MTVYVDMPLVPGTLVIENASTDVVHEHFKKLLADGGVVTFRFPHENDIIINLSRVPYVWVRANKLESDDEGLGLLKMDLKDLLESFEL